MSRRNKSRLASSAKQLVAQTPSGEHATTVQPSASYGGSGIGYGGASGGYQGADWSRLRGYVYWPTLDTRKELSRYTRTEILRKVRFLKRNVGLVSRLTKGMARMVAGTGLEGQATTTDKAWNKLANQRFHDRAVSRAVFDVGGRFNFYESQCMLLDSAFTDGDIGAVLTSSQAGLGQLAFYEAHQIGSGQLQTGDEKFWYDGVRLGLGNRPTDYRLIGDDNTQVDIPAENFIYLGQYESPGFARSASLLKHAINKLQDTGEILTAITTGIKQFNQIGYAIETAAGSDAPTTTGPEAALGPQRKITAPDGQTVTVESIYGPGAVPKLGPGQTLRNILDSRPHPNNLEFLDYLIRDIAWGAGLSPEVIWNIATLGGANTRFILADAQGWIEQQQQRLIDTYCSRVWIYFLAKEMKAGRLPRCQDPEWWKHTWITPSRLTVDFGRDGALHIKQVQSGMLTLKRFYGWQGVDSEEQTTQWLDEIAFIKAGLNEQNAALRTPTNRNLEWADIAAWRNVNAQPNHDAASQLGQDGLPTDIQGASTALAKLVTEPAKALALLKTLAAAA